jgi:anti-sigma28 factor (negative regulator of flagellin synthesis)
MGIRPVGPETPGWPGPVSSSSPQGQAPADRAAPEPPPAGTQSPDAARAARIERLAELVRQGAYAPDPGPIARALLDALLPPA